MFVLQYKHLLVSGAEKIARAVKRLPKTRVFNSTAQKFIASHFFFSTSNLLPALPAIDCHVL